MKRLTAATRIHTFSLIFCIPINIFYAFNVCFGQIYALRKQGPRKAARFGGVLCALTLAALFSVGILQESRLPLSDHSNTLYSFNKCFAIDIGFTFNFSCPYSSGLPCGKLAKKYGYSFLLSQNSC